LVGYVWEGETAVIHPGQPITLTLYWQVGSGHVETPRPSQAAPLAAFVHLSAATDPAQIVAQFDGWPTAVTGLETGDVIAQPVTLTIRPDTPPGDYVVRVGLYSPQTGERLALGTAVATGDAFQLTPVIIIPIP
jgi:hypothetical protein